ncbi:MAG: ATP-binding protein [Cyanobacteria bacterium J06554_11]
MKITTKFIGSSALLIALTSMLSTSSYLMNQRVGTALDNRYTQTQETVSSVVQLEFAIQDQMTALSRLSVLEGSADEQVRYERSRQRFFTALQDLRDLIPSEDGLSHAQLEGIRQQHQYLETLAERLSSPESADSTEAQDITRSLRLYEAQTDSYIQSLLTSAQEETAAYSQQQQATRNRAAMLELLSFSAVISLLFAQYYGLLRPVMRAINRLKTGTDDLGQTGRAPIEITTGDELQALAKAFNQASDRLANAQQILESKVEERTASLKQAQMQLVQSEKMASLSQLVAGVAHEINNPVSFIQGNLEPARSYIVTLISLLNTYQAEYPDASAELQSALQMADLAFIQSDFPQLLDSIETGAERITTIVRSLQTFSHLDESETKAVDIHQGIDSTLLILSSRLIATSHQPAIKILRHYGVLPKVYCYPGQLNQVFMGLLSNAIDAVTVERRPAVSEPTITITTEAGQDCIRIAVQDNGIGMDPDILQQVFDPFFTTKAVGNGAGLGLSMSYQIVQVNHQGNLTCKSEPGQGTTFTMEIPLSLKIQHESPTALAA